MINKSEKTSSTFTRRTFFISACQGALIGVLLGRLTWLQIVEGKKYKTLSEKNRINAKLTAPLRGEIVDRFGVPLAVNEENFHLLVTPEKTMDVRQSLNKLKGIIQIDEKSIEEILEKSKSDAAFVPIEVATNLDWQDVANLEVNMPFLPGISVEKGLNRNYPYFGATAHVIGYVGAVTKKDMSIKDPVLRLPGFRIGKTALEKSYDHVLRGEAGLLESEVNVRGREVRKLNHKKSVAGERLTLTIDAEFQRFCQDILAKHKSASCVVMNAKTGAIYAMASQPTFDPNLFTQGISAAQWQEILDNPAFPMNNKALMGQYPPGSTFKMITALAALEGGIANSKTSIFCSGSYELGRDKFHCWDLGGHGSTNVVTALMKSCDTYFYKLSTEIGIDAIAAMAQKFGLGQKYDFDIEQEQAGLMPTKKWKEKKLGKVWRPGETVIASIGQGYMLATPLQLAVMTARLVNGGYAVKPFLVSHLGERELYQKKWSKIEISGENLSLIKKGMDDVVNNRDGTAFGARIQDSLFSYGGKTGTAQVKRINRAERAMGISNEDLEWKYRHHALFVGYAPLKNPEYVCSVVVEHGGGGSAVAAPLAKEILLEVQKRKLSQSTIKVG